MSYLDGYDDGMADARKNAGVRYLLAFCAGFGTAAVVGWFL